MWSTTFFLSVLLAARLGAAEQAHLGVPQLYPTYQINASQSDYQVGTFAETLVSTLSASKEHTTFLHLLQRAKCIPLLAHIGNATVFAPTDKAWDEWAERNRPSTDLNLDLGSGWLGFAGLSEWLEDEEEVLKSRIQSSQDELAERARLDNQNWALRQHLLYHMLNYTLSPLSFIANESTYNISTLTTLLYPLAEEPPLPPVPEPGAPWIPHGGEGLLGGQGQRVRLALPHSKEGGQRGKIGVDWTGQGGASVWDGKGWETEGNKTFKSGDKDKDKSGDDRMEKVEGIRWVRNGAVVGIEGVLDMPPSIEEIIKTHPSLSHLSRLLTFDSLPTPLPVSLSTTPHLTIFAPANEAFDVLDDIEHRYLDGPFGEEGVGRIVGNGVVLGTGSRQGKVGWSDHFADSPVDINTTTAAELQVQRRDDGSLIINGTEASAVDIFASNGVIHIVPSLILPEGFTLLNSAEKTLLSLNATRFVSLLRSADLSDKYIGERGKNGKTEEPYTILAPTDEVMDMLERQGPFSGQPLPGIWRNDAVLKRAVEDREELSSNLPIIDSSPLASLLQYHILPGRLLPSDIEDGMLLGTELRTLALKGDRQRLLVDVSERPGRDRNDWETIGDGEIRFCGATVLGKPVKSGKSIIYLISNLLSPPDDVFQTAVSDLQLSTFIAAVYAAGLDKVVKHTPATTYFMPRNRAFTQLGLTMKYLLLPEGKDELRKVVKYHAVNEVIYSPDVEVGKQKYTTLEGGKIVLERTEGANGTISLRSPSKWSGWDSGESLPSNGELKSAKVIHGDALTQTGVIHTIDQVVLPADVKITNSKLIRGSKQFTMMDLISRAGLAWVLEGREPNDDEVSRTNLRGVVKTSKEDDDDDDNDDGDDEDRGRKDIAYPSYTVLVPTDKAFSRLNLTYYLSNKEALLDLVKLHIIPSENQNQVSKVSSKQLEGIKEGHPLILGDDSVYSTLLSASSKYGDIAFRATGDNSFIVGIRNARARLGGEGDSARIGQTGRASVRWRYSSFTTTSKGRNDKSKNGGKEKEDKGEKLWIGGMALGGGVMMVDSVLIPYKPSWISRWGWLVATLSGIGLILLIAAVSVGWWYVTRDKKGYESVEGEDGTLEGEDDE